MQVPLFGEEYPFHSDYAASLNQGCHEPLYEYVHILRPFDAAQSQNPSPDECLKNLRLFRDECQHNRLGGEQTLNHALVGHHPSGTHELGLFSIPQNECRQAQLLPVGRSCSIEDLTGHEPYSFYSLPSSGTQQKLDPYQISCHECCFPKHQVHPH